MQPNRWSIGPNPHLLRWNDRNARKSWIGSAKGCGPSGCRILLGIDEHACFVFKFEVLAAIVVKGVRFG